MSRSGLDSEAPSRATDEPPPVFAAPAVEWEESADGGLILKSSNDLASHERCVGEMLRRWARRAPERVLFAERGEDGGWREVTYGEAERTAASIAQALLDRDLGPDRGVMVLSGNSIDHGLLMLGCLMAGVPVAAISPAYALQSGDFRRLASMVATMRPGLVYVGEPGAFIDAIRALDLRDVELVANKLELEVDATPFSALTDTIAGPAVQRAFDAIRPDDVAKVLFTSGTTGEPKGVVNTHRMLCSNQQALAQVWPFTATTPVVLVDWLPWSHTFGGNHNVNLVLKSGGTLYIDAGRPLPGQFETSVRNMRDVSPTIYLNVPTGFAALLPLLESDDGLAATLFARLHLILYAGASLPEDLWHRLQDVALRTVGRRIPMTTGWGATETAPMATAAHFPLDRPGNIGIPVPGVEVKLAPVASGLELRVRGPNVTPGYLRRPDLTAAAMDSDGFYRTGDAGRLVDRADPSAGILFAGRIAEDFKLTTGTWVRTGALRTAVLAAAGGMLQHAVIAGHDEPFVGVLAWLNPWAAARLVGREVADPDADPTLLREPAIVEHVRRGVEAYNRANPGSSSRVRRVLLLADPPSVDAGELTDKGQTNQRAVLTRRRDAVARLFAQRPDGDVIIVA